MVQGLSHITFVVRDLGKMEEMLTQVLDANKIYDSGDKTFSLSRERFFDIAGTWVAIMEGEPLPTKTTIMWHLKFYLPNIATGFGA